jgi:hypothetical protein
MLGSEFAYTPTQWSIFLSAEVGASAALTGLLFVAVSINLARIISSPQLTPRVAKALVTLIGILFAASLCLVPGQSKNLLGSELVVLGAFDWVVITLMLRAHSHGNAYISRSQKWLYGVLAQMATIPLILCGASLLCLRGGGLYWLVVAVLLSFASSLIDAWVLLIEIQR